VAGLQCFHLDQLVGNAMSQENCGSCQHWHVESGKVAVSCECRRFPPVIVCTEDVTDENGSVSCEVTSMCPMTPLDWHCGEYKKAVPT